MFSTCNTYLENILLFGYQKQLMIQNFNKNILIMLRPIRRRKKTNNKKKKFASHAH